MKTVAALFALLVLVTAGPASAEVNCACTAPDNSCSVSISCGDGQVCTAACANGGGCAGSCASPAPPQDDDDIRRDVLTRTETKEVRK